ncbi:MAG: TerC/Alx family metal homeostasis membrane protein [Acidobacteriaceae bacterium]|nr:TerC/Alx family metal homeostasis membrane protein [Acidobacteriaceae bacterium]
MPDTIPVIYWVGFHLFVAVLMAAELIYVRRCPAEKRQAAFALVTVMWIAAALVVSGFVLRTMGPAAATQYLAGYVIEESLSIDNLFVFMLLFGLFGIRPERQPAVLFWGVAGAIVMRGLFITAGIGLLDRFAWIGYGFGAILLVAAVRLFLPKNEATSEAAPRWLLWLSRWKPVSLRQDRFLVVEEGQRMATVLLLALIAIELADLVFAIDSIPAVLSVTRHPFLAYASNIMAVMGLRSLYFVLALPLKRLRFLRYGLAAVLAFAAVKMLSTAWWQIGPLVSLAVIVAMIGVTVILSLVFTDH